jgi:selenium-binding protein 1
VQVKGSWEKLGAEETIDYGYDFWYQPHFDVLVSTEWGAPSVIFNGFDPSQVPTHYGDTLYFWSFKDRTLKQKIKLGAEGLIPLETRFLHNPWQPHGFVGAALSSNVIHFTKGTNGDSDKWVHDVAIKQEWVKVEGWALPELPPLITDILISLDDKFLFFSNWLRGDIVQYDISEVANGSNAKFVSRVWIGGSIHKGTGVKVLGGLPEDSPEQPEQPTAKGVPIRGGPQMLQLSLDGKRLYVTTSLFSPWDKQFYPELAEKGAQLLKIDVTPEGLKLDQDFLVDFGNEPEGPVLAHEVRYPGGDSSSDIWIVQTDPEHDEKLAAAQ